MSLGKTKSSENEWSELIGCWHGKSKLSKKRKAYIQHNCLSCGLRSSFYGRSSGELKDRLRIERWWRDRLGNNLRNLLTPPEYRSLIHWGTFGWKGESRRLEVQVLPFCISRWRHAWWLAGFSLLYLELARHPRLPFSFLLVQSHR